MLTMHLQNSNHSARVMNRDHLTYVYNSNTQRNLRVYVH